MIASLLLLRVAFYSFLPGWARVGFVLAVLSGVACGALGIWARQAGIHSHTGNIVAHFETLLNGMTLGLIFSLILSGQFGTIWRVRRWKF